MFSCASPCPSAAQRILLIAFNLGSSHLPFLLMGKTCKMKVVRYLPILYNNERIVVHFVDYQVNAIYI